MRICPSITWQLRTRRGERKDRGRRGGIRPDSERYESRNQNWETHGLEISASWYLPTSGCFRKGRPDAETSVHPLFIRVKLHRKEERIERSKVESFCTYTWRKRFERIRVTNAINKTRFSMPDVLLVCFIFIVHKYTLYKIAYARFDLRSPTNVPPSASPTHGYFLNIDYSAKFLWERSDTFPVTFSTSAQRERNTVGNRRREKFRPRETRLPLLLWIDVLRIVRGITPPVVARIPSPWIFHCGISREREARPKRRESVRRNLANNV